MIYWLVGSSSEQPELAEGVAPRGLLGAEESSQLAAFPTLKRRHDWLLGRWTAKHLVQTVLEEQMGVRLPLHALTLQNGSDGAPYAFVDPQSDPAQGAARLRYVSLSISHCDEIAFCALYPAPLTSKNGTANVQIGADIERIAPRSTGFTEDYFSSAELAWLQRAPAGWYDTLVNAIWSAKEAVLKALHLGLTVDTRRVSCLVSPLPPGSRAWMRLDVRCDPSLLKAAGGTHANLCAWWRMMGDYVLTLAALSSGQKGEQPPRPVDWLQHPTFKPILRPAMRAASRQARSAAADFDP